MTDFNSISPGAHSPAVSTGDSSDGLVQILGRQWRVAVVVTVVCLLLAGIYLLFARPVYTSVAKVRVQPMGSQIVNPGAGTAGQGEISSDFLNTECDVIMSNPVVALALGELQKNHAAGNLSDAYTIRGIKAQLSAELSDKGQSIDVSFNSTSPDEANRVVTAIVQSYQEFESNHWKTKVKESLNLLEQGKANQRQELQAATQKMLALAQKNGGAIDTDPDKSAAQAQVQSLNEALTKAHLETINAKSAYDEAAKAIVGDPVKLQQVADLEKQAAYSANPGAQLTIIQAELFRYQANLAEAQRQYMPNHPIVKTIQARIDQLTVACVADAEQWWQASQAKEDSLKESLAAAQKAAWQAQASAVQYMQLQAEINSLKKVDDIDTRIKDLDLIRGAGATNITVLDPATLTDAPRPRKGRTMAIALVLGLIAGLGIACGRDWMDDRLRSPEAVQMTIGAPVLGAVPAITTAYTAADRGQIVHNDPFSEASESYRTLRTALQYGLPQGAKTLLITSPAPGEGKSTLVSNLAIALAQANKRVLVIDADFRAPMQHRLFGLKDRSGLATVLGGADTLEQAIQRTEIEGLDLLPCGPIPHNPAEMLNDPAFSEHLNDLADRYDLVLLDSPPVTAVTDARIIAASTDATLLVVRPEVSTRRQAEQSRDGLRGVGARLIGVAVNGAARAGQFSAASGYYSRAGLVPGDSHHPIPGRSHPGASPTVARPMNRA